MSIIQRFLTNQIVANEIIIVMTPYCPTPLHLLHTQEGVNLLSLKTFGESKCHVYLNSLWNNSHTHYSDVRWCTSERWVIDERKRGRESITPRLPFPYPNIFYTKPSFNELANPLCLWLSGTENMIWVFFLCVLIRNVVCTLVVSQVQVCAIHVHEFKKVSKIIVLWNFDHAWDQVYNKKQNCSQGSDTNLEFNAWPLPK